MQAAEVAPRERRKKSQLGLASAGNGDASCTAFVLGRFYRCANYMFVLAPGATGNHLWASLSGIMLESTTVTPRGATPSLEAMSTSRHAMR